uniref:Uncharacterized protein n=1 Tax=Setaria italica TaxID=4555 RepID=K3YBD8_SETIT
MDGRLSGKAEGSTTCRIVYLKNLCLYFLISLCGRSLFAVVSRVELVCSLLLVICKLVSPVCRKVCNPNLIGFL